MNALQTTALEKAREIIGEHFDDVVVVVRSEDSTGQYFDFITSSNHFVSLGMLDAAQAEIRASIIASRRPRE